MCVIIIKNKGIELPDESVLRQTAACNPHGFGFCTPSKLYKTLSFWQFIKAIGKVDTGEPCIIHFRYATTGSIKRANCHPFRVGDISFAHNGHLYISTSNDRTDSETFFRSGVLRAIDAFGYDSPDFCEFMRSYSRYSRFAIMKGDTIGLFGTFVDMAGCQFSNLRFTHVYPWCPPRPAPA